MLFGLLVACGSPGSDATLDEDNWLSGSFVDTFDPTLGAVELAIVEPPAGSAGVETWVYYLDDRGVVTFGFRAPAIPAPDGTDPFPQAPAPVLVFDAAFDIEVAEVSALSLEWEFTDATESAIAGTFAVSFITLDDEAFDVDGAFAGPVSRMTL